MSLMGPSGELGRRRGHRGPEGALLTQENFCVGVRDDDLSAG